MRRFICGVFSLFLGDIMTKSSVLNSDAEVNSITTKKKHNAEEYKVEPCTDSAPNTDVNNLAPQKARAKAIYSISNGQTRYYYLNVGSGVHWLEVDLNWGNTANTLSLNILNPSRANLGTYFDNADGKIDGRTHLSIYPNGEYVAQGKWVFKVKGDSVSGTQHYTIMFYTH